MFEMIGLLIGTAIVFSLSVVAGLVFAGVAFLILWRRSKRRVLLMLSAAAIPVCSTAYMWLCVAILPGETLFGDIDQPLPNGYVLKALGKMPEYGNIQRANGDLSSDGVKGDVDMVAVNGPLVAGRYCQSCDPAFVQSKASYFILDTRLSNSSEYDDLPSLEAAFHSNASLVENQYFRSREPTYLRRQRTNHIIEFTPPIILTLGFLVILLKVRRGQGTVAEFKTIPPLSH